MNFSNLLLRFSNAFNRHPYVDLGPSVYWATMNVGARFDYEYGDVFQWGEIRSGKGTTYKFYTEGYGNNYYTRYTTSRNNAQNNKPDYQSTLLPQDDVAHQYMSGSWRMPTIDEMEELLARCHWQALLINRTIRAYRITGQNGNSILLPQVALWTSSLHEYNHLAYCLNFNAHTPRIDSQDRKNGFSIRAVLPQNQR